MSTRPKGYMNWTPPAHVAATLINVRAILEEYGSYGPMTVRQIFYRLVGSYGYDKTELAYKRLASWLVKARRAQIIGFDKIRDDGGTSAGGDAGWSSVDQFLEDLAAYSTAYSLDRTLGQPYSLELWCEAEGMVPMLEQMTRPYNVQVTGSGGFSSVTVTHAFAARVVRRRRPTVLLHVGDYDPSGESIFLSMCQDIGAFVAGRVPGARYYSDGTVEKPLAGGGERELFVPRRVALTESQVAEYDLPTAPPKASDSRSTRWVGETTQAEALPPDLLAAVITAAVEEYVDHDARDALIQRERRERELIGGRVEDAINAVRAELEDESDDE